LASKVGGSMSKDKSEVKLIALIKHIELIKKQQGVLRSMHEEYSCDRAISTSAMNMAIRIHELAIDYLEGKDWVEELAEKIKQQLASGHYQKAKKEREQCKKKN